MNSHVYQISLCKWMVMNPGGHSLVYLCLGPCAFLGQCHIVYNASVDICLIAPDLLWVSVALRKDEPSSLTTKFLVKIKSKGTHWSARCKASGPQALNSSSSSSNSRGSGDRQDSCVSAASHRPWGSMVPSVSQF